ncbi:hypothetical protein AVEN_265463-1 [Araneus ventricosus]|uniref:Uncharacterized protein n=1 Tax=Araneus ventricosus TaxID=182803 RepID=A0A4Y2CGD5_ARAVE|nr:hypothetical protein AVEN_265463-1 [Araneus ventricosus]
MGKGVVSLPSDERVRSAPLIFFREKIRSGQSWGVRRKKRSGRPAKITANEYRYKQIVERKSRRNRQITWCQIGTRDTDKHGHQDIGSYGNPNVLFKNDRRFCLSSYSRHQYIWFESSSAYSSTNILEVNHYRGDGVMVWAGKMLNGCMQRYILKRGTLNAKTYRQDIVAPHVRKSYGAIGNYFIFMEENDRCHRVVCVDDLLESERIHRSLRSDLISHRTHVGSHW